MISLVLYLLFSLTQSAGTQPYDSAYSDNLTIHPQDSIAKYKQLCVDAYLAGNMDDYKQHSAKVLAIAQANNLPEIEVRALVNVAIYYQQTDQYEQALKYYLDAADLVGSMTENSTTLVYLVKTNLANLYISMGKYDEAISTAKDIIAYAKTQSNPEQYVLVANNALGTALINKKEYAEGLAYMLKVKKLATQMDRKDAIIIANSNIGECYLKLKEYKKAIDICNETLAQITVEDSKEIKSLCNLLIGQSFLGLDEPAKALANLIKAKDISETAGFLKINMEAHQYLAQTYEKLNNYENSLQEHKEYSQAREKYLKSLSEAERLELEKESEDKSSIISEQEKSIDFLSQEKQIYLWIGIAVLLALAISTFLYTKRRKQLTLETEQLRDDKELLENENGALKYKLEELAKTVQEKETAKSSVTSKPSSLSKQEQKQHMQNILDYMETEKPYLDPDIKQSDIAQGLGMSVHLFSEILNACFEKNFNNFINLYRVDKAKSLMQDPKFEHYKILAIGYEAGFPSKTSFNRVFKNLVGMTPSEYQGKVFSGA
ncbi:AraC family transcriptional regulator [Fulvivirga ligni]|uniref:AraC family transcriptional regulator n=1 Tax=Fulvivirga ligni TaxID=2904246 RepID=UPI001F3BB973|nr:AraC family transcriptional regulator [Fulvivirga ligni]UII20710.1 helix-turn-helix domain-containing protein [Fulvivirga ligni]